MIALCEIFHPSQLPGAEDKDVDNAIDMLLPHVPLADWPQDVINALLSKKLSAHKDAEDFEKFFNAVDVWLVKQFSLKAPIVGTMPNTPMSTKIAICTRILYKETLVVMLGTGAAGVNHVSALMRVALGSLEIRDALDMACQYELIALKEYLAIWHFSKTLLVPTVGLKYEDFSIYYYCCRFLTGCPLN